MRYTCPNSHFDRKEVNSLNRLKDFVRSCRVPKEGKVSDRTFLHSITVSIFSILLCMVMLSSVTWAWFSEDVSSNANTVQSASCEVDVSVTYVTVEDGSATKTLDRNEDGVYKFAARQVYTVTLTASGTASTAYCKFLVGGQPYYTAQIPTKASQNEDGTIVPNSISFTLQFTNATEVEIITRWGSCSVPAEERAFVDKGTYVDSIPVNAS